MSFKENTEDAKQRLAAWWIGNPLIAPLLRIPTPARNTSNGL